MKRMTFGGARNCVRVQRREPTAVAIARGVTPQRLPAAGSAELAVLAARRRGGRLVTVCVVGADLDALPVADDADVIRDASMEVE